MTRPYNSNKPIAMKLVPNFFFLKERFLKEQETELKCPDFRNMLRTYPRLRKGEEHFFDTAQNHGYSLFLG